MTTPASTPLWIELFAEVLRSQQDRVLAVRADHAEAEGWTGTEFARRIGGAASALDAAGCRPGDVVPALITTSPEALALVVAGSVTGRPLAPLSPRLTVTELAACVEKLDSAVVVCEPGSAGVGHELARRCGRKLAVIGEIPATVHTPELAAEPGDIAYVLH